MVTAREFRIVDGEGRIRGALGMRPDKAVSLEVFDPDGQGRLAVILPLSRIPGDEHGWPMLALSTRNKSGQVSPRTWHLERGEWPISLYNAAGRTGVRVEKYMRAPDLMSYWDDGERQCGCAWQAD